MSPGGYPPRAVRRPASPLRSAPSPDRGAIGGVVHLEFDLRTVYVDGRCAASVFPQIGGSLVEPSRASVLFMRPNFAPTRPRGARGTVSRALHPPRGSGLLSSSNRVSVSDTGRPRWCCRTPARLSAVPPTKDGVSTGSIRSSSFAAARDSVCTKVPVRWCSSANHAPVHQLAGAVTTSPLDHTFEGLADRALRRLRGCFDDFARPAVEPEVYAPARDGRPEGQQSGEPPSSAVGGCRFGRCFPAASLAPRPDDHAPAKPAPPGSPAWRVPRLRASSAQPRGSRRRSEGLRQQPERSPMPRPPLVSARIGPG